MDLNERDYEFLEALAEELELIDDIYKPEAQELKMIIRKLKRND